MSKPKCPKCDSMNVVPSLMKNSHNNCVGCGYSGFVREFHEPEFRTVKARDPIMTEDVPVHPATKRSRPFPTRVNSRDDPDRKPYWWERD